jgi:hypothetical protein
MPFAPVLVDRFPRVAVILDSRTRGTDVSSRLVIRDPGVNWASVSVRGFMLRALKRLLAFLGFGYGNQPPGADRDPYAWRPVPRTPRPKTRSGAVAVVEPDE